MHSTKSDVVEHVKSDKSQWR